MQTSVMKELAGHRMHVPCMSEFFPYAKDEFGWTRITLSRRIAEERSEVQLKYGGEN